MPTKKKQRAIAPCAPVIKPSWQKRALGATDGTRFGAIIRCALDVERDAVPRFVGKAVITSDGFVQCDFVSSDGAMRHGAFVGDAKDIEANTAGLIQHLELMPEETQEFLAVMSSWIAMDYRSNV